MPKMKNVAKNKIVLHDPYSNALCPPPQKIMDFFDFSLVGEALDPVYKGPP